MPYYDASTRTAFSLMLRDHPGRPGGLSRELDGPHGDHPEQYKYATALDQWPKTSPGDDDLPAALPMFGMFLETPHGQLSCWGTRSALQRRGRQLRCADRAPGRGRAGGGLAGRSGLTGRFHRSGFRAGHIARPLTARRSVGLLSSAGREPAEAVVVVVRGLVARRVAPREGVEAGEPAGSGYRPPAPRPTGNQAQGHRITPVEDSGRAASPPWVQARAPARRSAAARPSGRGEARPTPGR